MLEKLLSHTLKYSLSSLLVTLAGFISFPIFTRIFTVEEYGTMSYISSVLMLLVVFGKLGIQHAIVRFHSEVIAGKRDINESQYVSTVLFGLGWTGVVAMLLGLLIGMSIPDAWLGTPGVRTLLLLTITLVPIRVIDSAVSNLLRAEQRSGLLSIYTAVRRYFVLGAVLLTVFYWLAGLRGFFIATIVSELIVTAGIVFMVSRNRQIRYSEFSARLLREMIAFGLPMIAYDFAGVVLNLGDRFIIEALLGPAQLGVYSAAYNMCEYASVILLTSLNQAVTPMYLKLWEEKGLDATRAFVDRSLHVYLLASAAIMTALSALGADAITVLASEKYREGGVIIPAVMGGMLLAGCVPLLAAGLHIKKQTQTLMFLVIASAVTNVALNFALIPHFGLLGAAFATLFAFALMAFGAAFMAFKTLPIRIPIMTIAKFTACGLVAYFSMRLIQPDGKLHLLMVEFIVGAVVFTLTVLAVDSRTREAFSAVKSSMAARARARA